MYVGPTSWGNQLAARLAFWFRGWVVPSVSLVVSLAVLAYLGWCLLPPLVTHYQLRDEIVDIARRPLDDGDTRRLVMEAIEKRGVTGRLDATGVTLLTASGTRKIGFSYDAEMSVIPGRTHRLKVSIRVREPVLFRPETKHF